MSFLAVLPCQMDNLPLFYEPIRRAIVRAFKEVALTPSRSGTHAPATSLYRGPARIAEVLSDDDLSLLTSYEAPLWAANPPQQNQREDRFLDSLEMDTFAWAELVEVISMPHESASVNKDKAATREHKQRIERWIEGKEDAWIMRFYALLGEACDTHYECITAKELRIVRVVAGEGEEHALAHEAFLMPEQETSLPQDIRFVKPTVYKTGRSEAQRKFALSFLEHIGVRQFNAKAAIELKLRNYDDPPDKVQDSYYKDIKQFIAHWKKNPTDAGLFKGHGFLLGLDEKGNLYWAKPEQTCMDKPYFETGLAGLQNIHNKYVLWDGYQDRLPPSVAEDFGKFLRAIGVGTLLEIVETSCLTNPDWRHLSSVGGERHTSPINRDYTIQGLKQLLAKPSLQVSRLIWRTMCSLPRYPDYLTATYQKNERWGSRRAPSQLVHALRRHSWVPQGEGVFVRPAEGTRELLPEGFPFDAGDAWVKAVNFGSEADRRTREYQQKQELARELGFDSPEEAAKWKRVKDAGISPDQILDQWARHSRAPQPEEAVPNPERRRKGVLERRENAPLKESVTRERTIQPGARLETLEAKAYLRAKYRNLDGQLVCQCCHAEMPFKVGDDHYFEAVQCVQGLNQHFFENRLALCPTCAAMYLHARETDDVVIRRSIIEHDALDTASSAEITIRLAGRTFQLRFVGTHWFDLKTVLDG